MSVKGYCVERQARNPNQMETPGWDLNGQIKRRTTSSFPAPKINMKMTRSMTSSGRPK